MTKLSFIVKQNIYGRDLFFPNCELSKAICVIAKRKTLLKAQIDILKIHFDITINQLEFKL